MKQTFGNMEYFATQSQVLLISELAAISPAKLAATFAKMEHCVGLCLLTEGNQLLQLN
jgi:uncharacterized membrane protein (UPF0136 family)